MHACTHMYIWQNTHIHMCIHTYTHIHTHTYVRAHTHTYVRAHTHTHTHTHTHMHTCVHIHKCTHTTHTHTHTHTHTLMNVDKSHVTSNSLITTTCIMRLRTMPILLNRLLQCKCFHMKLVVMCFQCASKLNVHWMCIDCVHMAQHADKQIRSE